MRSDRSGFSVLETLVALLLSALLVQSAWSLLRLQSRVARRSEEAADRLETVRIARHVLEGELRAGVRGRDWSDPVDDTLGLRAFRGLAVSCGARDSSGRVPVRVIGIRTPDPTKDSLLLLLPDGGWRVVSLDGAGADTSVKGVCPPAGPGWTGERWTIDGFGAAFVLARFFERGSYHLADGALRYRRGRGGRQPLVPDLLDDRASRLRVGDSRGSIDLHLVFRGCVPDGCGGPWDAEIRGSDP